MSDVALPDGRTMSAEDYAARLELLRKPFAPDEIEKLPKQLRKNDDDRGRCEQGTRYSADGHYCGGYHARSMHLDYVGHAGITDRLNDVDPLWTWEPMAVTEQGTPLFTDGGMWGKLTVLGVTRLGFGDSGGKSGTNAVKEIIGDFLRNAAMRFGVGTYLWSKSEAALAKKQGEEEAAEQPKPWDESQADAAIKFALRTQQPEVALRKAWDDAYAAGSPQPVLDRIRAAAPSQQQPTRTYESEIVE